MSNNKLANSKEIFNHTTRVKNRESRERWIKAQQEKEIRAKLYKFSREMIRAGQLRDQSMSLAEVVKVKRCY